MLKLSGEQTDMMKRLLGEQTDMMKRLLGEQTDMMKRLLELQKSQQEHRPPLHPLYNHLPSSPCSIASSPRCPRMRVETLQAPSHSRGWPKQQKAVIQFDF
ncbi:unnamed protein product [Caretta caretta]